MQDVATRHSARLEPILLILQLALQQIDRFFLHTNETAVQDHLIKLLARGRDHLIDRIPKRVIAVVAGEVRRAYLRDNSASGKDHLRRLYAHIVLPLHHTGGTESDPRGAARSGSRRGYTGWSAVVHLKMRIGILECAGRGNLRQCFRSHLNVKAFRSLDLLPRDLNGGILLQRRQNCLIQSKPPKSRTRGMDRTHHATVGTGEQSIRRRQRKKRDDKQARKEKFSHGEEVQYGL